MIANSDRTDVWIHEYLTPWDIYAHGVKEILVKKKTKYQEMCIFDSGIYGKILMLDGDCQSCTSDEFMYHEPLVHPGMIFHGSPRKVLILGGGEGATAREVLRWRTVEEVLMVELDGELLAACQEHLPEMHQNVFDDPRLRVVIADALTVLDSIQDDDWDVVISDLASPMESGPALKLFTKEYFEKIHQILSPQGFLAVQAGPISPPLLQYHTRLVRTLQTVFPHCQSYCSQIPSYTMPWGFVLCSEQKINNRPNPDTIDLLLKEKTKGGFKMLDGSALLGLLQLPLYVRQAIAEETQVYTLAKPPDVFSNNGCLSGKLGKQ